MHGPLNVKFALLGAFAKLRTATVSFVMLNLPVCPSALDIDI